MKTLASFPIATRGVSIIDILFTISMSSEPLLRETEGVLPGNEPSENLFQRLWNWLKTTAKDLKHHVLALYYATQHPDCGILPKFIAIVALAYALSPLDIIPDFIPILGILDDFVILPVLIWLTIRLIPQHVWDEARERATSEPIRLKENIWFGIIVGFIWIGLIVWFCKVIVEHFMGENSWFHDHEGLCVLGLTVILVAVFIIWFWRTMNSEKGFESSSSSDDD